MSNENIIREIDEELRSDRMRNIWRRFGAWIIGAGVVVVLAVAVNEGWQWWQNSNSSASSDQFYAALELADGTDIAAAQEALNGVIAANHGGYPVLARFRSAALLAADGKPTEAIAAYDAIATAETNKYLRDLALALAGNLLVDSGDLAQVEQRVGGLANGDSALRNAARESIGLAKYKAGDLVGARTSFEQVMADPLASTEARTRLQIYLIQLISEGAEPAEDVAVEVEAPADAAAPDASVGDAPAMDTAPAAEPAPAN
ncbi:MAG: tetratricopeptide repeat protein [Devosia sp.]